MVSSSHRGGRSSGKKEMGELIKFGLAIFVTFALVTGFFYGLLLLMFDPRSLSSFSALFLGMLGYLIILFSAPVIALVLGIRMGRHAKNPRTGAITGLITGGAGHILLWVILIFFMMLFSPSPYGGGGAAAGGVEASIIPYIVMVFPSAIACSVGGYFSNRLEGSEGAPITDIKDFPSAVDNISEQKEEEDSFDEEVLMVEEDDVKVEECPRCGKKGLHVYQDESAYCKNCDFASQSFQLDEEKGNAEE